MLIFLEPAEIVHYKNVSRISRKLIKYFQTRRFINFPNAVFHGANSPRLEYPVLSYITGHFRSGQLMGILLFHRRVFGKNLLFSLLLRRKMRHSLAHHVTERNLLFSTSSHGEEIVAYSGNTISTMVLMRIVVQFHLGEKPVSSV